MVQAVRRYGILMAGMVACGALCSLAAPYLLSPRGTPGPTILQSQSPIGSLVAVVLAVAVSALVAVAAGRLINAVVGMFVLGVGLFVLARPLSGVEDLAFAGGSLSLLAAEAMILAAMTLGVCVAMWRVAGPLDDIEPAPDGRTPSLWGTQSLIAAAAGVLVLPAVWFVATSTMKGQVIGAVFVGGLLADLVGRLLRPHVQPAALFVSPLVFAAAGYLIAAKMTPAPIDRAFVHGSISPFALPMPLDYAAGTLLGVAIGLGWAKSFLHHEEERHPSTAAA